ncbi:glycosyltransferase family 4 protein [Erwinia persicina]|uniref:glycosyltransferase family 4 protein n=1 Tax=Erwinia persicina TaxID=55211 RepID=UPI0030CF6F6D
MNNKIVAITANTSWYIFNFRKNTILELINNHYTVVVLAPRDDYTERLIGLGCHFNEVKIDRGGVNPLKDLSTLYQFYNFYKKNNVSVVLNFTPKNNIYSTIAAYFNNLKVVNNIAGLGTVFTKNNLLTKLVKQLYKYSQSKADFIFFQNKEDCHLFTKLGIDSIDSDVLPGSGVDLLKFKYEDIPDDGLVTFSLVARLLIDKGIIEYAEAAKKLKLIYGDKVCFQLIGFLEKNNPRSVTSDQINEWVNAGYIDYLGKTDDIATTLKNVDCVVLPSFYREGVPKSLLEAAALGKPIVTTDNVGCRDTVDDGVNGYICMPGSSDDLALKMELIINKTHLERVGMGRKGRDKIVKFYDEKIVINKYLAVIDSIVT